MKHYDVIIVGGGLAGLTAAIHLSQEKHKVLVLEKKAYPHHKVCGEYVSNEILPYLKSLGVELNTMGAVQINTFQLSTASGQSTSTKLALGGIGISRYAFDNLLYQKAMENGVNFEFEAVASVSFINDDFKVVTESNLSYTSRVVIGAYGKRSSLDKKLNRNFINEKSAWLAVKSHYEYESFPENKVALHNFKGGYGGLSKTEKGTVNFCYLTAYSSFQKEKSIEDFNANIVAKNPFLHRFLEKASPVFDTPLTIAQISFAPKKAVENHMIMCGDTAGLIHPLCGNGMAMAIHSAKIAAAGIHKYLNDKDYSRTKLETAYALQWRQTFGRRLWMGRQLQSLLLNEKLSKLAIKTATISPFLLGTLIKTTHGKPIAC